MSGFLFLKDTHDTGLSSCLGEPLSGTVRDGDRKMFHSVLTLSLIPLLLVMMFVSIASDSYAGQENTVLLPEDAKTLHQKASDHFRAGRYAEAELLWKQSLAMLEKAHGSEHPSVATIQNNLAALSRATGRFSEAETLLKKSLAIYEKILGPEHPSTATCLNNLAELYRSTGRYAEAQPLYRRALAIYQKTLGPEHHLVAMCLNNLGELNRSTGRYDDAESLFRQSLAMRERVLGSDHTDVAQSLNNLAALYESAGRYAEAEPLYRRALAIYDKAFGPDHPDGATCLSNLAELYRSTGRYAEAEPYYRRALAIYQKTFGLNHHFVAIALNNLGGYYESTGRYREAEPLFQQSLAIREVVLGSHHPLVATALNNLAGLYESAGRYAEAEPLYKRSLVIYEKNLGAGHPDVAQSLNNLAELYRSTGRYAEAEPLYKRSLFIYEKTLGPDHPSVATGLNNLGGLYESIGRNAEVEPLYKRSLAIREKVFGPDHPLVATSLNSLGGFYVSTGRHAEAEPLFKRSLAILERVLGPEHPDVASSLNNLAFLRESAGRYAEAEFLYKRSLAIRENVFGPEHSVVATSLNNLAVLYGLMNNHRESHALLLRGLAIEDRKRENVFQLFSEQQKIRYMKQNDAPLHALLTLTSQYMGTAAPAALDAWLSWKGAVLESQGRYMDVLYRTDDPVLKKKLEELSLIRMQLARLQMNKPESMKPGEYKQSILNLQQQKETLEAGLSALSRDFALEKTAGTMNTLKLSRLIPHDAAYIDIADITIFDFKKGTWKERNYLVFVLLSGKEPAVKLFDLGKSADIDKHIRAYQIEMQRAVSEGTVPRPEVLEREAKAVHAKVIAPIAEYLKGKKQLYISPDGNLNLIPFEVLLAPDGRYLMDEKTINYLGAGRDMVRFQDAGMAGAEAVIMADPDYNLGLQAKDREAEALGVQTARLRGAASRDLSGVSFRRLRDTRREAEAIAGLLHDKGELKATIYQDKKALEEVLFARPSPRILHLATHGYFLKPEETDLKDSHRGIMGNIARLPDLKMENPMLRSGIVLAGANASIREGRDDGLVSAEKVLGLRLKGTELVVLSACETGMGDVQAGEGVFGLKRAFILSGAKTMVMSLWSVPSRETTELMTEFYRLMAGGTPKAEALRQAKLAMKQKNPNPFYWGAFVMTGKPD